MAPLSAEWKLPGYPERKQTAHNTFTNGEERPLQGGWAKVDEK